MAIFRDGSKYIYVLDLSFIINDKKGGLITMAKASIEKRLPIALVLMRITVFVVMFVWTLDKFIRPEHAAGVYANFYFITGIGPTLMYLIAAIELVIIIGFLIGLMKRLTYGLVFILHAISTFATFPGYLAPYTGVHLLFFAAWPMLAACFALYYLRDYDTILTVSRK